MDFIFLLAVFIAGILLFFLLTRVALTSLEKDPSLEGDSVGRLFQDFGRALIASTIAIFSAAAIAAAAATDHAAKYWAVYALIGVGSIGFSLIAAYHNPILQTSDKEITRTFLPLIRTIFLPIANFARIVYNVVICWYNLFASISRVIIFNAVNIFSECPDQDWQETVNKAVLIFETAGTSIANFIISEGKDDFDFQNITARIGDFIASFEEGFNCLCKDLSFLWGWIADQVTDPELHCFLDRALNAVIELIRVIGDFMLEVFESIFTSGGPLDGPNFGCNESDAPNGPLQLACIASRGPDFIIVANYTCQALECLGNYLDNTVARLFDIFFNLPAKPPRFFRIIAKFLCAAVFLLENILDLLFHVDLVFNPSPPVKYLQFVRFQNVFDCLCEWAQRIEDFFVEFGTGLVKVEILEAVGCLLNSLLKAIILTIELAVESIVVVANTILPPQGNPDDILNFLKAYDYQEIELQLIRASNCSKIIAKEINDELAKCLDIFILIVAKAVRMVIDTISNIDPIGDFPDYIAGPIFRGQYDEIIELLNGFGLCLGNVVRQFDDSTVGGVCTLRDAFTQINTPMPNKVAIFCCMGNFLESVVRIVVALIDLVLSSTLDLFAGVDPNIVFGQGTGTAFNIEEKMLPYVQTLVTSGACTIPSFFNFLEDGKCPADLPGGTAGEFPTALTDLLGVALNITATPAYFLNIIAKGIGGAINGQTAEVLICDFVRGLYDLVIPALNIFRAGTRVLECLIDAGAFQTLADFGEEIWKLFGWSIPGVVTATTDNVRDSLCDVVSTILDALELIILLFTDPEEFFAQIFDEISTLLTNFFNAAIAIVLVPINNAIAALESALQSLQLAFNQLVAALDNFWTCIESIFENLASAFVDCVSSCFTIAGCNAAICSQAIPDCGALLKRSVDLYSFTEGGSGLTESYDRQMFILKKFYHNNPTFNDGSSMSGEAFGAVDDPLEGTGFYDRYNKTEIGNGNLVPRGLQSPPVEPYSTNKRDEPAQFNGWEVFTQDRNDKLGNPCGFLMNIIESNETSPDIKKMAAEQLDSCLFSGTIARVIDMFLLQINASDPIVDRNFLRTPKAFVMTLFNFTKAISKSMSFQLKKNDEQSLNNTFTWYNYTKDNNITDRLTVRVGVFIDLMANTWKVHEMFKNKTLLEEFLNNGSISYQFKKRVERMYHTNRTRIARPTPFLDLFGKLGRLYMKSTKILKHFGKFLTMKNLHAFPEAFNEIRKRGPRKSFAPITVAIERNSQYNKTWYRMWKHLNNASETTRTLWKQMNVIKTERVRRNRAFVSRTFYRIRQRFLWNMLGRPKDWENGLIPDANNYAHQPYLYVHKNTKLTGYHEKTVEEMAIEMGIPVNPYIHLIEKHKNNKEKRGDEPIEEEQENKKQDVGFTPYNHYSAFQKRLGEDIELCINDACFNCTWLENVINDIIDLFCLCIEDAQKGVNAANDFFKIQNGTINLNITDSLLDNSTDPTSINGQSPIPSSGSSSNSISSVTQKVTINIDSIGDNIFLDATESVIQWFDEDFNIRQFIVDIVEFITNTDDTDKNGLYFWFKFSRECDYFDHPRCDRGEKGLGFREGFWRVLLIYTITTAIILLIFSPLTPLGSLNAPVGTFLVFLWVGTFFQVWMSTAYFMSTSCFTLLPPVFFPILPNCLADDIYQLLAEIFETNCINFDSFGIGGITTSTCPTNATRCFDPVSLTFVGFPPCADGLVETGPYERGFADCSAPPYNFDNIFRNFFYMLETSSNPEAARYFRETCHLWASWIRLFDTIQEAQTFDFGPSGQPNATWIACNRITAGNNLSSASVVFVFLFTVFIFLTLVLAAASLVISVLLFLFEIILIITQRVSGISQKPKRFYRKSPPIVQSKPNGTPRPPPVPSGSKSQITYDFQNMPVPSFSYNQPPPMYPGNSIEMTQINQIRQRNNNGNYN